VNTTVTLEHRFLRTPDGAMWTPTVFAYPFWKRYLAVFEQVRIVARVLDAGEVPPESKRVDGPGVIVHPVPHYHGPLQFANRLPGICKALRESIANEDAVIMRVPSFLSVILEPMLRLSGRPYCLEVVGDPYDVFAPGVVKHPLRPVIRHLLTKTLQRQCRHAAGVAYVTKSALQKRYPCSSCTSGVSDVELGREAFCSHFSSIELAPAQLLNSAREDSMRDRTGTIAFVGSLEQLYKAPDVLLKAVARCVQAGFDLELLIVGDGRYRGMLEKLARDLGIAARCHFLGQVPAGAAVQQVLDAADLFVLPSRTEGLPRAMIEAMARSLPCIGSRVGGIPELLPEEDMVSPGDITGLATKIQEMLSDRRRRRQTSQRNNMVAREYVDTKLQQVRTEYYTHVRDAMRRWLGSHESRGLAA
jgi:glycosyltransferase involved in cell wall biosynthesis